LIKKPENKAKGRIPRSCLSLFAKRAGTSTVLWPTDARLTGPQSNAGSSALAVLLPRPEAVLGFRKLASTA
jgi:hypothetical protein